MEKAEQIEPLPGLKVQRGKDGHWIFFEADGMHGGLNVENMMRGIARSATIRWIDELIDQPK